MSLVTKGILTQQLPWGLVLLGVFTSLLMEVIGVPALAFAVGMYLPLESTTPIFLGGFVRRLVDRARGSEVESDAGPGVLYSSGLVAGGSIMGLLARLRPSWEGGQGGRIANQPAGDRGFRPSSGGYLSARPKAPSAVPPPGPRAVKVASSAPTGRQDPLCTTGAVLSARACK